MAGIKDALKTGWKAFTSALGDVTDTVVNNSTVKDVVNSATEVIDNATEEVADTLRSKRITNLTKELMSSKGATANSKLAEHIRNTSDDIIIDTFKNLDSTEQISILMANPELARSIDLPEETRKRLNQSIVNRIGKKDSTDNLVKSLYERTNFGEQFDWQSGTKDFDLLTAEQQKRVLSEGRKSIDELKTVAYGSADADISKLGNATAFNNYERTEWNKKALNSIKKDYYKDVDKWAKSQGGGDYNKQVNAYKQYVEETVGSGEKSIYQIDDIQSFMQKQGMMAEEVENAPLLAKRLSQVGPDGAPNSEKNKRVAKFIAKHPVPVTVGVMGTIWGVSELKDEDWT